jgi:hypothetical protein
MKPIQRCLIFKKAVVFGLGTRSVGPLVSGSLTSSEENSSDSFSPTDANSSNSDTNIPTTNLVFDISESARHAIQCRRFNIAL